MLVTAIALGVAMETWWKEAVAKGVDVLTLRHVLRAPEVTGAAQNALELVVDLGDDDAVAVLEQRLREPGPAAQVLDALGRLRSERAAQALPEPSSTRRWRATQSTPSAVWVPTPRSGSSPTHLPGAAWSASARARRSTHSRASPRLSGARKRPARQSNACWTTRRRSSSTRRCSTACRRGSGSTGRGERGVDVWAVLRALVSDSAVPVEKAENALLLLHELEEREALDLLVVAAAQPRLRERAENSLEARGALEQVRRARDEAVGQRPSASGGRGRPAGSSLVAASQEQVDWAGGGPIVGPDTAAGVLPLGSRSPATATGYDVLVEDPRSRARRGRSRGSDRPSIRARTGRRGRARAPAGFLGIGRAARPAGRAAAPDLRHSELRHLPRGRAHSVGATARGRDRRRRRQPPQERRPRSMKNRPPPHPLHRSRVYGHASRPESLVLTDTDLIRFVFDVAEGKGLDRRAAYALAEGSALVLGFSPSALSWRVLWEATLFRIDLLLRRDSFIVALPPENERERELVERQLERMRIVAYWDSARLHRRASRALAERRVGSLTARG